MVICNMLIINIEIASAIILVIILLKNPFLYFIVKMVTTITSIGITRYTCTKVTATSQISIVKTKTKLGILFGMDLLNISF